MLPLELAIMGAGVAGVAGGGWWLLHRKPPPPKPIAGEVQVSGRKDARGTQEIEVDERNIITLRARLGEAESIDLSEEEGP